MYKENTKVRKRRGKGNQQKRKLTTRKPANNRKLERNRGKTAKPGPTQRITSPTNRRYTGQAANAGKRQEHSGKAEGNKRGKAALTEPALMRTAPLTSLGLMSGTLLAATSKAL
jgi:hypothetical protein